MSAFTTSGFTGPWPAWERQRTDCDRLLAVSWNKYRETSPVGIGWRQT